LHGLSAAIFDAPPEDARRYGDGYTGPWRASATSAAHAAPIKRV
jgi:hypothetical protein